MLEILQYTFFQRALIAGILMALISAVLGLAIVLRREANITHSIANFLFFGIALSLLLEGDYYTFTIIFGVVASICMFYLEKSKLITGESSKEIISQSGMALGLFVIGFLGNLQLDITNFLFGSILFVQAFDIYILIFLGILIYLLWYFFGKNFLATIIHKDLAFTKGIAVDRYNFMFLILVSVFIAVAIKIFGILLVASFLILPANIAKVVAPNLMITFIVSLSVGVISVISGLFASYFLDTSSGASIVLVLIIFFILAMIYRYSIKKI